MLNNTKIAVIGLGYVGLPLAVHLAHRFKVIGFDISAPRIEELNKGFDRTREVDEKKLKESGLLVTFEPADIEAQDVYIVTVPTPVDAQNKPDLTPVIKACGTVGKVMKKGAVVVFESTVYPGVTEDICGPELEKISGLKCGEDFYLGYSPERINPGDKEHTVDRITKVVAGQTPEIAKQLGEIYGAINQGNVHLTPNIKTAEAAKVIENAQRDINIAFINEIALIFRKLGISIYDVLAAAGTKWNFLPFTPGLVGGHCIGVDPFYLAHCAKQVGHNPEIILSGRRINDSMGNILAEGISEELKTVLSYGNKARILFLGLTFKEDVPDLRNTKVYDVIAGLEHRGHVVNVFDPHADPDEAKEHYGIELEANIDDQDPYDCVIGAVPHKEFKAFTSQYLGALVTQGGIIVDLKGMWRDIEMPSKAKLWSL